MMQPVIIERVYAAKGNSAAADALIRDYLPFIKAETSKLLGRIVTEDTSDELSIAMIAFHEAVDTYQKIRGAFLKYASVLIRHRLIDYYRREKRHTGHLSLYSRQGQYAAETLPDNANVYDEMGLRDAARHEIGELTAQLSEFGLSLTDIADNCPKQERTLTSCRAALRHARDNPQLIAELKRTKKLPISALSLGSGTERKTLERHRKYLIALLLIYSNGYEMIRGHLKQVLNPGKGGAGV